jgi:hypothetical protein
MIRPWSEIERFYRELGKDAQPTLRLVERIQVSRYASMLHAWTSMMDLCIVQVPGPHPYDGPFLRISPRSDGTMEFRYLDTGIAARQWHRIVKAEDAFDRLERFMEQLHWIGGVGKRGSA